MKKWLAGILIGVMAMSMLMTGCGEKVPGDTPEEGSAPVKQTEKDASEQVELRLMWWGSQNRHDRTLEVTDKFREKYPNIMIEPEFSGWDGYWEKIAAQAAANNLPDIFQQDYAYLKQYAEKGLLAGLNDYVESKQLDLTDASENSISGGKINGNLYGVNLGTNSLTVAYDPALFQSAGVPQPQPGWTWEDYMETVRKLHQALGIYGDGSIPGNYFHGLKHYVRQHGFTFYNAEGSKLGYEDDQLFVNFFKRELDLVREGVLPKPDVRLEIKSVENELIVEGKAAMSQVHSNQLVAMVKAADRPLSLAMIPSLKGEKKPGHYLKPSMFFSVAKSSKNVSEAVQFINYFTNDVEANKVLMAERGVPISSKVREALEPSLSDVQKTIFEYINLVIENSSPIDPPDPAGHSEVDKLLDNIQAEMLYEKITLEEGAEKFRTRANQILEKNKK